MRVADIPASLLSGQNEIDATQQTAIKVPFEQVIDLVRSRQVAVHAGYAFISDQTLADIVVGIFRMRLSEALTVGRISWGIMSVLTHALLANFQENRQP